MTEPHHEPRFYLVTLSSGRYDWDYLSAGRERPVGHTIYRHTEDEIRAVVDEWNARLDAPQPDTQTLDLFGGDV